MIIMRSYFVRTLLALLICGLTALPAMAADKPVKVYILSGQSNMVGIGQANPGGMTRYNTYVSAAKEAKKGATLSIYRGAYNADTDYNKLEPIETHHVMLGYWPHTSFPTVEGPSTHVARAFIRIDRPGRYSFQSVSGSILELDGKVICEHKPDEEPKTQIVKLQPGTFPIKVTYFGRGRSNLSYKFYDVPGSLHTVVKEQGKYQYCSARFLLAATDCFLAWNLRHGREKASSLSGWQKRSWRTTQSNASVLGNGDVERPTRRNSRSNKRLVSRPIPNHRINQKSRNRILPDSSTSINSRRCWSGCTTMAANATRPATASSITINIAC